MMKEEMSNELLAFEADYMWMNENRETLLEQYAQQWTAAKNGR